ncbi:MAG: type 4a pilus biogenesis protein PilO [Candidatus Desulfatibia sp.]|uniref:type 4a pilus biogenesis protein PilO n=1 Tax=Candidatus Desulfatibia sp. TaxID=3101189 RepID=UPI002F34CAC8
MRLSLKALDLICLFTVIIIVGMCGFWVAKQGVEQKTRMRQENALYASGIKNMSLAASNLQHLNTGLKAVKNELKATMEQIPEAVEIGKFLKQLDSLVKRRNIVLITLQPLPKRPERYFTKIPIRLMFKGAFNDIYYLLHALETMKRLLVTEKITISKGGIGEQCRVDLTLNIFEQ